MDERDPKLPDDEAAPPRSWGEAYEASRAQRAAALVVAGGVLALIAGTVMSLTAGGCILDRVSYYGNCSSVLREPWFGLVAMVTVLAAAVGSVLAVRDLTQGR